MVLRPFVQRRCVVVVVVVVVVAVVVVVVVGVVVVGLLAAVVYGLAAAVTVLWRWAGVPVEVPGPRSAAAWRQRGPRRSRVVKAVRTEMSYSCCGRQGVPVVVVVVVLR